jgi:hypothetical protein
LFINSLIDIFNSFKQSNDVIGWEDDLIFIFSFYILKKYELIWYKINVMLLNYIITGI